jgi:hypothetical protein
MVFCDYDSSSGKSRGRFEPEEQLLVSRDIKLHPGDGVIEGEGGVKGVRPYAINDPVVMRLARAIQDAGFACIRRRDGTVPDLVLS